MKFKLFGNKFFHAANRRPTARRLVPMFVSRPEVTNEHPTEPTSINPDGAPRVAPFANHF